VSEKFDRFVQALEALCREHGCQIATSMYDGIEVGDLREGDEPIHSAGVEDCTSAGLDAGLQWIGIDMFGQTCEEHQLHRVTGAHRHRMPGSDWIDGAPPK
jgi:hypothetical protein